MTLLEQDGLRRRGRSNIHDSELKNDGNAASSIDTNDHETKNMMKMKNNVQVSSKATMFIRFLRSNNSMLLLLISFGILLGVWLVWPEAFSTYYND